MSFRALEPASRVNTDSNSSKYIYKSAFADAPQNPSGAFFSQLEIDLLLNCGNLAQAKNTGSIKVCQNCRFSNLKKAQNCARCSFPLNNSAAASAPGRKKNNYSTGGKKFRFFERKYAQTLFVMTVMAFAGLIYLYLLK